MSDARVAAGSRIGTMMPAPLRRVGSYDMSRCRGGANEETL
ncbi:MULTISPECIES: hypothetical protein [unclassified Streptomyces]